MMKYTSSIRYFNGTVFTAAALLGLASPAFSSTTLTVTQDGWVNAFAGVGAAPDQRDVVQGGGTSATLETRTPDPAGAFNYNLVSYLGFDTSAIDFKNVIGANLTFTIAANPLTNPTLRVYIINDNSGGDSFDETTLDWTFADTNLGLDRGNAIEGAQVTGGVQAGEATAGAAGTQISIRLSPAALSSLVGTGNFVTFAIESRSSLNGSVGLASRENTKFSAATLEIIYP